MDNIYHMFAYSPQKENFTSFNSYSIHYTWNFIIIRIASDNYFHSFMTMENGYLFAWFICVYGLTYPCKCTISIGRFSILFTNFYTEYETSC
jgi:hypothetical protein